MKKTPYEDLDDIIFELNENADKNYHKLVDGPLDNRAFLRNLAIGVTVIFAAPILALIILVLMSH